MYEKIVKENGFQDVENVGLEWVSKILKISMKSWGYQRLIRIQKLVRKDQLEKDRFSISKRECSKRQA